MAIPFSCKTRICPSCIARKAETTAIHLLGRLPEVKLVAMNRGAHPQGRSRVSSPDYDEGNQHFTTGGILVQRQPEIAALPRGKGFNLDDVTPPRVSPLWMVDAGCLCWLANCSCSFVLTAYDLCTRGSLPCRAARTDWIDRRRLCECRPSGVPSLIGASAPRRAHAFAPSALGPEGHAAGFLPWRPILKRLSSCKTNRCPHEIAQ